MEPGRSIRAAPGLHRPVARSATVSATYRPRRRLRPLPHRWRQPLCRTRRRCSSSSTLGSRASSPWPRPPAPWMPRGKRSRAAQWLTLVLLLLRRRRRCQWASDQQRRHFMLVRTRRWWTRPSLRVRSKPRCSSAFANTRSTLRGPLPLSAPRIASQQALQQPKHLSRWTSPTSCSTKCAQVSNVV